MIDGCLTIDKAITIKAAAGLTPRVRALGCPLRCAISPPVRGQQAELGREVLTGNGYVQDVLLWGVCPEVGVTDGEDKQLLLVEGAVDRENPVKLERVRAQPTPCHALAQP